MLVSLVVAVISIVEIVLILVFSHLKLGTEGFAFLVDLFDFG